MKRIFIISLILMVGAILLIFPLIRDENGSIEEDKKEPAVFLFNGQF